jgi:uncharacterized protein YdhG (YjbR/CyaY superfamily)
MATTSKARFKTVDEYLSSFPKAVSDRLKALRKTIRQAAPNAEELISYNMPAYKLHGFLVSFAAWKKHIGLYPIPAGDATFKKQIENYKDAKSTAQFPYDEPLPLKLIARLVKFRVKENKEKVKSR